MERTLTMMDTYIIVILVIDIYLITLLCCYYSMVHYIGNYELENSILVELNKQKIRL